MSAVAEDVDDCRAPSNFAKNRFGLTNPLSMVSPKSMKRAKFCETLVHPSVYSFAFVSD